LEFSVSGHIKSRQKLKSETKEWERQVAAIARILQTAS